MAEPDDDRESVDRAFAELVAGYHLTAERPALPRSDAELSGSELTATDLNPPEEPRDDATGAAETIVVPLHFDAVPPTGWRAGPPWPVEVPDERYVPDALPPLSRPGAPALVGWAAVLFAAAVVLAAGFGVVLPAWLGWLAVSCFIVGCVVLLTQLPRHRPPDAGDGAVL
jgi:hypothetical protein